MKGAEKLTSALVIASALAAVQVQAQCWGGHHHGAAWHGGGCQEANCWSSSNQPNRIYDPKTVGTIAGEVVQVEKLASANGLNSGVHLQLKTGNGTISVHLGPSWYLDNQEAQIQLNDRIEVTGSRITLDGKAVLLAAQVRKGDWILKLRDENGFPMWAGWRRSS